MIESAGKLVLGTAQFGSGYGVANLNGEMRLDEVVKVLHLAREYGVTTLDTARGYGESERKLGVIGVSNFDIVTKVSASKVEGRSVSEFQSIHDSLSALDVKAIYAVLIHDPASLMTQHGREVYQNLLNLKQDGLIQKIGVSIYNPEELNWITSNLPVDIVQAPFSIADQRLLQSGWLRQLSASGIEVHARSIFLQGLLLMPVESIPAKFSRWQSCFIDWNSWLSKTQVTALQACLAFPLSFSCVSKVTVGIDSLLHLQQIFASLQVELEEFPGFFSNSTDDLLDPRVWGAL